MERECSRVVLQGRPNYHASQSVGYYKGLVLSVRHAAVDGVPPSVVYAVNATTGEVRPVIAWRSRRGFA